MNIEIKLDLLLSTSPQIDNSKINSKDKIETNNYDNNSSNGNVNNNSNNDFGNTQKFFNLDISGFSHLIIKEN